jgi:type I restriction enzyme M protein
MSELTQNQLESHLFESANILRGKIDNADFKSYVFPLLFFKRISDVYDEEFEQALKDSDGDVDYASFAENHRFQVPAGSRWLDVRERTENVGEALKHAMRSIEKANPDTLYGIFGDTQWTNKERLSDALLCDLIEHFSSLSLGNASVEPDVLGNAYEYLIKRFADLSNKAAGEFYTPRSVVAMLVNMLDPKEGETVYDPACGTGGMLIEVVKHVEQNGGRVELLWGKVFGQETNLTTEAIARMNLFLHGVEDFKIVQGDTLRDPAFFTGDSLATFDCVIANPPFSLKDWGHDEWQSDRFGRNATGVPPKGKADFAWIQHMIGSMAEKSGRLAVVLPQGALFRAGAEKKIRKQILEDDLVEAVIGLAPNLFYGAGLAACVVVMRKQKAAERKGKVVFIDASKLLRKGRNQNTLEAEHREQIETIFANFEAVDHLAHVATIEEITENDFDLNIGRYVEPEDENPLPPLPEAIADLKLALEASFAAEDELIRVLKQEGLVDSEGNLIEVSQ